MGSDIAHYIHRMATDARTASRVLRVASTDRKNHALEAAAEEMDRQRDFIKKANGADLARAAAEGLAAPLVDRLRLDDARLDGMIRGVREIAALPDPVGEVDGVRRPAGFRLEKVRVPLGVVAVIYESRPNVTADAAALCLKSGNACILRGGKEALQSGLAIAGALCEGIRCSGLPAHALQYLSRTEHEGVTHLVRQSGLVDLVVPRGGEGLIRAVVEQATVPVIKHYKGNCHLYVDRAADLAMALDVVENSKVQRVSVCNTLESLLVHADVATTFLPRLEARLEKVELRGCERARRLVPRAREATEQDWGEEYLDYILSVKVVDSLDEAVEHIERYGSHHTDGILTADVGAAERFVAGVDSAVVTVNASTRLADGGVFGLGAEIGVSTDKLHSRGPMGVRDLTTIQWVVRGEGALRS